MAGTSEAGVSAGRVTLPRRAEAALFDALRATLGRFRGAAPHLAAALGGLAHRLDRRHRRVAFDNVRAALPGLDGDEARAVVRASFRNLAATLLHNLAWGGADAESYRRRFTVEGWEHLDAAEGEGRGVILLTGHLGNWEAMAQLLAIEGRPLAVLARPMDNPLLERRVRGLRERFGNRSIPKRGGARQMFRVLKGGGRLALTVDQRVHPNEGEAFDFFGRPAYTTPLPAQLSLRTGAPAVPFFGLPEDGGRIRVRFHPPIPPEGEGPEALRELTRAYLAVLEEEIRRHPGLWLWMHRRWRRNPTTRGSAWTPPGER